MFAGAKAKLKRANEHIGIIPQEFAPDTYAVDVEPDADSPGNSVLRFRRIRAVEHDLGQISLIVGDAVHNLRSALDARTSRSSMSGSS